MWSLFILFMWISATMSVFDINQAQIGVWLSGAAYCEDVRAVKIGGPATGFEVKTKIVDPIYDLKGYVGILRDTRTIYVVFRGSASLENWIADFEIKKIPYASNPDCNASIHDGFYKSALHVKDEVYFSLDWLKIKYPGYKIIVTGHSYGAAVAEILAMELLKDGFSLEVYNYGQPRVGDANYAVCVNKYLGGKYWRITHNRDIVPHIPPIIGFGFIHSCGEIFEDQYGGLRECSKTWCEDATCADRYNDRETNVEDHLTYLGHRVSCEESIIAV